ncbi:TetR/AcrR family transcriptional regulator C-terminal domain-containing protein [Sphingomonas montanisoli]|uniref:TetR/AcrR family transcriptional regulator C-terminal domain-containing protein n=1 Tax=Sphingomonas montanisoli TaxID=2606412 RepID=UPI0015E1A973|nr:TetR/AcrR family transcriptional regulator C-terminal domain-containing protein [Sphingomonas montanisoli]
MVEAGKELGLEHLSISAVAMRLGVGLGTIYTYVENKDELYSLVAVALSERPAIRDDGQHWADIIRANAAHDYELLAREPELLRLVVSGAVGPEEGLIALETQVALLVTRGFTPEKAFELCRESGRIAVGAAVSAAMARAWERQGETRRVKVTRALLEAPDDQFPHLRAIGSALTDDERYSDYRPLLERVLTQVAFERGEALPPASILSI